MYIYKNEYNRQQTDDWLWDTILNTYMITHCNFFIMTVLPRYWISEVHANYCNDFRLVENLKTVRGS